MTQQDDSQEINKLILTTGIRVGTQVRTKFMRQFTAKTSDDGLYRIDLDLTLAAYHSSQIYNVGIENLCRSSTTFNCDQRRFMPGIWELRICIVEPKSLQKIPPYIEFEHHRELHQHFPMLKNSVSSNRRFS